MAEKRKKRKRKSKASSSGAGGGPPSGGGLLQGIQAGIRRAAGTDAPPQKSSRTSNIITIVLLLGAFAFFLYRWYG